MESLRAETGSVNFYRKLVLLSALLEYRNARYLGSHLYFMLTVPF